jgi:WD repeat-containing protein 48
VLVPYEMGRETLPELLNAWVSFSSSFIRFRSLYLLKEDTDSTVDRQQSKLTASRFLRVRKLLSHVQDKLEKLASPPNSAAMPIPSSMTVPSTRPTPRSSLDRRTSHTSLGLAMSGHGNGGARPKAEDLYEILCNDVMLPLDMTLAVARQFVWRQSGELVLHYRRKVGGVVQSLGHPMVGSRP